MSEGYKLGRPLTSGDSDASAQSVVRWVTIALIVQAFVCVLLFTRDFPWSDEWEFVPAYLGDEPLFPWLWTLHNEHRLPLPRLIVWTAYQLTHDYRTGCFIQVVLLALASVQMLRLVRDLRGSTSIADCWIPISLLHFGHAENFTMGYQVCFALTLYLVIGLIRLALTSDRMKPITVGLEASISMIALTVTGAFGLLFALATAGWIFVLAFRTQTLRGGLLLAGLAFIPGIYLAIYLHGYERPEHHPPSAGILPSLGIALEMLSMSLGLGAQWLEPISWIGIGVMIGAVAWIGIRRQNLGILAVLGGVCLLAFAIGWGRSGFGRGMGYWARYGWLAWPLIGLAYACLCRSRWVCWTLAAIVFALLPINLTIGIGRGIAHGPMLDHQMQDRVSGMDDATFLMIHFKDSGQLERVRKALPLMRDEDLRSGMTVWTKLLIGIGVLLGISWLVGLGSQVQQERARELFRLQHERLGELFLERAHATGLPRGLSWIRCDLVGDCLIVRDRVTRHLVGLIEVTIGFEAIEGSDMEGLPAVDLLRQATAMFVFEAGQWTTTGKVVFNHTPIQVMERWVHQYQSPES